MATCVWSPVKLKSSDISAKYSWPSKEQNDEIHDSGVPDEEDILIWFWWARGVLRANVVLTTTAFLPNIDFRKRT